MSDMLNNNGYYSGGERGDDKRDQQIPDTFVSPSYPERTPSYSYYNYTPPVQPREPEKRPKGPGRFLRAAAAAIAVLVISAASGAGAAWFTTQSLLAQLPAPAQAEGALSSGAQSTAYMPAAGATDITQVVKAVSNSVVEITTETKQTSFFTGEYVTQGAGSGVVLSADGYIVTNNHVIEGATNVTVRMQDGSEYKATLVGTDKKTDLAVIKIEAAELSAVALADSASVEVGQTAIVIGNPLGELGGTVTSGIISAKDREITIDGETMTLLQTSAAVNPGNSGGGLFDHTGKLVGVVNAKSAGTEIEGLGFAIPSNVVRTVTDSLISNGYVTGRPQFGVMVQQVSDIRTAAALGVNEPGVYVVEVLEDNGLREKDRLISVNEWQIRSTADLAEILKTHEVGDTVSVTVKRDGREATVQVTLTEKVPDYMRGRANSGTA